MCLVTLTRQGLSSQSKAAVSITVRIMDALLFGVHTKGPDFWKLSCLCPIRARQEFTYRCFIGSRRGLIDFLRAA